MFAASCVTFTLALLLSVNAESPFAVVSKDMKARSRALHKHKTSSRVREARKHSVRARKHFKAASTVEYVNVMYYVGSGCSSNENYKQATYGTGICVEATSSDPSVQSAMLSYSSTSNVLTETFYSDTACSTSVSSQNFLDFGSYSAGSCVDVDGYSGEFTVTSSASVPSSDGYYEGAYVSESTCNSGSQPFFQGWYSSTVTVDDDFDDDDDGVDDNHDDDDDDYTWVNCAVAYPFEPYVDDDALAGDDNAVSFWYIPEAYYSIGTTSGSSSSKSSCFAGSELVQMASGESVRIDGVQLGDVVLGSDRNGKTVYSEVIAVPHARNNEVATFTHLETISGKDILLTPEHLILVNKACDASSDAELMAAASVTPGMCVMTADNGLDRLNASEEVISREGIYTIVLKDAEFVVVNGVVASPFAVNHAVANAYYNVIRALPSSLADSSLFKKAALFFGTLVSNFAL